MIALLGTLAPTGVQVPHFLTVASAANDSQRTMGPHYVGHPPSTKWTVKDRVHMIVEGVLCGSLNGTFLSGEEGQGLTDNRCRQFLVQVGNLARADRPC